MQAISSSDAQVDVSPPPVIEETEALPFRYGSMVTQESSSEPTMCAAEMTRESGPCQLPSCGSSCS